MAKNEFICDCNIVHKEVVDDTLKKMPEQDLFNKIIAQYKIDVFYITSPDSFSIFEKLLEISVKSKRISDIDFFSEFFKTSFN